MTITEAVNKILRSVPDRWPIPLPASAVIVVALTISINSFVAFDKAKDFAKTNNFLNFEPNQCRGEAFDYVIVGAGAAGMIVATRIANASTEASSLLLEAGGEPTLLNELPSMDFFLLNQPANTWIYNSTPQRYSCGHCDDRRSLTTRGRMLGGSTGTSFMLYVRGNPSDYDRWGIEDAGGDPQWSYKALLPYFRKSEDYNGAHQYSPDAHIYHGKGGLLNVATFDYMPGTAEFLAAAREKGYRVGDYNGEDQQVFSPIDVTTQDGWRESTYRAFYRDTGKPSNLCIKKYSHVTQINFDHSFDGNKPKAVGVTYSKHKKLYQAWARKEVILSAGTMGSAKLLLLSGVGPAHDLQSLGIDVVMDLPVGQSLQDHACTIVGPFLRSPSLNPNRDITPQAAAKFLIDGTGAIAAPAGLAGVAFFQSPFAQPPYPDLEVVQFSVAMYPELPRDLNKFFGFREDVLNAWFHPYHRLNTDARFLVLWLGRPKSVGTIRLASKNPEDNPIIDPQYLRHPDDVEALLYGFKKVVDLYENTKALNTPLFRKPVPNCEHLHFKSDEYYRCVIRHLSSSIYHHVGSCALGKVVDNNLRVKGIDGLRIIDASVIPRTPNGDTEASTCVVAEKGADLVINGDKGGWGWGNNEYDPSPSPGYNGPSSNNGYNWPPSSPGYNGHPSSPGYNGHPSSPGYNGPPSSPGYGGPPSSHGYKDPPSMYTSAPPAYRPASQHGSEYGSPPTTFVPAVNFPSTSYSPSHGPKDIPYSNLQTVRIPEFKQIPLDLNVDNELKDLPSPLPKASVPKENHYNSGYELPPFETYDAPTSAYQMSSSKPTAKKSRSDTEIPVQNYYPNTAVTSTPKTSIRRSYPTFYRETSTKSQLNTVAPKAPLQIPPISNSIYEKNRGRSNYEVTGKENEVFKRSSSSKPEFSSYINYPFWNTDE